MGNIALHTGGSNNQRARDARGLLSLIIDGHGATASTSGHGANIAQNHIALGQSCTLDIDVDALLSTIILAFHKVDSANIHGIASHNGHALHILRSIQINISRINPATALEQGALLGRDAHCALFGPGGHAINSVLIQLGIANIAIELNIVDGIHGDAGAVRSMTHEINIKFIISLDAGVIGIHAARALGPNDLIMLVISPEARGIPALAFLDRISVQCIAGNSDGIIIGLAAGRNSDGFAGITGAFIGLLRLKGSYGVRLMPFG